MAASRTLRVFATAPTLPDCPFATMAGWARWLSRVVCECLAHASPGINVVVLPEIINLPVITTGPGLWMSLARKWLRRTSLAMLLTGGVRVIRGGFPAVIRAQEAKLVHGLALLRDLARQKSCYIVTSGFWLEGKDKRLVNRLWVIDPHGEIVKVYDKQSLTPEEVELGVTVGRQYKNPFFRIAGVDLAAVICFDMFDPEIQSRILARPGVKSLLVPSANGLTWAGYAGSGVWQPLEWLEGIYNWSKFVVVNSMLCGRYGATLFDGQASICGPGGVGHCKFPDNGGKCLLPKRGFYPSYGNIVWADLT